MQTGGSPFGTPPTSQVHHAELNPSSFHIPPPEAAPPINTRPPANSASNFDELAVSDDPLGGDDGGGGGISGNRWPRQETLALLKIRSDMDATFRDATLKGPLWEEVSRKLGELGFKRSAKKCKEKFENVHKYYKRTKEGRAGRQDGKSYRFFSQLEALHNITQSPMSPTLFSQGQENLPPVSSAPARAQPMQISAVTPINTVTLPQQAAMMAQDNPAAAGIIFSTNSSSSLGSESDDEATEEGPSDGRKRKRGEGGRSGKMAAFFEGLMRQVMERQEAMQQRFLEAIEKSEQDRMIREEAWRRQEMSRLAREHEFAAQERAAAASRDAAIISFLQKVTGQTIQLSPAAMTPIPSSSFQTQPPLQIHQQQQKTPPPQSQPTPPPQPHPPPAASPEIVPMQSSEPHEGTILRVSLDQASPSRWPKSEVHTLIKLRSELDSRYQESGPKGPLWEEISAGMRQLGYNRSSKRCKEKWENINKYFKKVKESNKRRPEDAKTCPYFHQLDALYRSKLITNSGGSANAPPALSQRTQEPETHSNPNPNPTPISMVAPPTQTHQRQQGEIEKKNGKGGNAEATAAGNGGIGSRFFGEGTSTTGGGDSAIMKKPEDIMKELMGGRQSNNDDYGDSDNMDDDEDVDEDDDDEDGNGQFRIQFQRQNLTNNTASPGAQATPNSAGGKASGSSFLAMVR